MGNDKVFPKFKVGDIVHIREFPIDGDHGTPECESGWAYSMSRYCGMEATITMVYDERQDRYNLDVDDGHYIWSADCFQESYGENVDWPDETAEEQESAMKLLFDGFSFASKG